MLVYPINNQIITILTDSHVTRLAVNRLQGGVTILRCSLGLVRPQKSGAWAGTALILKLQFGLRNLEFHADLEGGWITEGTFVGFHNLSPSAGAAIIAFGDGG